MIDINKNGLREKMDRLLQQFFIRLLKILYRISFFDFDKM